MGSFLTRIQSLSRLL